MQSPLFVRTWYEIYQPRYEPLLVTGAGPGGELDGVLALALDPGSRQIHVAGTHHAEYQTWLARPDNGSAFLEGALAELQRQFPSGLLRFLFLPPSAPRDWLAPDRPWASYCDWRTLPRPLMDTRDLKDLGRPSSKRGRTRLNRLRRLGTICLEPVRDPAELDRYFDDIILYTDFRQGAAYASFPFRQDPLKRPFYRALLAAGGLLHATVVKLNGQMISAHLGILNKDQVTLGILAYSPFLAEHSPGRLHILLLGMELNKQGIAALDLTPGADYKERFATHQDEVAVATVYFNRLDALKRSAVKWVKAAGKRWGIEPWKRPKSSRRPADATETRYQVPAGVPAAMALDRNNLGHLLDYQPEPNAPSLEEFLRVAMKRLEENAIAYTYAEGSRLVFSGWLSQQPQTVRLFGIRGAPGRTEGEATAFLRQLIAVAAAEHPGKQIVIVVEPAQAELRRTIEALGGTVIA